MGRLRHFGLLAVSLAFTAVNVPGVAGAVEFNQFLAFGDSTLDTGYFRYHVSGNLQFDDALRHAITQGATGGYAGNGVMNTTILGDKFGLSIAPVDAPGGGTNYANGGATTVVNPGSMVPNNVCTILQIQNYLASVNGVANPNALYLIKSGDNDVTFVNAQTPQWRATYPNYLSDGAAGLAEQVASLQAAGARTIVVRNSYDSALWAGPGGDIAPSNGEYYARSKALGTTEWADMTALGVRFIPADNDSLFAFVAHNPTRFGFTRYSVQSNHAPYANPHQSACFDILSPAEQRDYLFIDGVHLTTAGQTIEADYTYNLLVAPSQISLLAESVVQGAWARAATIQGQIEPFMQHRGPCGVNVWASAGASNVQFRNSPGFAEDSGAPVGGTVGVDYQTAGGVVFGMAFTADSQRQEFSTGGHFDQVEEAPSLYVAYRTGLVWGNAVLSFDLFQDEVDRSVPLGTFLDQNHANTAGQSVALALRGGRDFNLGRIVTGPVVGMVVQQVHVDDFTEIGDSRVTSLSFGGQTRNSCVSQLGWRVLVDWEAFQPFVEMNWDHEFAGGDRTITTLLTTVMAPAYTMDAVPAVSDWATLSLGAYYKLSPQVFLRGGASAMFINPQMSAVGGELGLNVSY